MPNIKCQLNYIPTAKEYQFKYINLVLLKLNFRTIFTDISPGYDFDLTIKSHFHTHFQFECECMYACEARW